MSYISQDKKKTVTHPTTSVIRIYSLKSSSHLSWIDSEGATAPRTNWRREGAGPRLERWALLEGREKFLEETRRGAHLRGGVERGEREGWDLEREERVIEEQQRWSLKRRADWGWLNRDERGEREAIE